jgi:hypothetical protein
LLFQADKHKIKGGKNSLEAMSKPTIPAWCSKAVSVLISERLKFIKVSNES